MPGTAIIRYDGQEHFGRVPEITDDIQQSLTQRLVELYPRATYDGETEHQERHPDQLAPMLVAPPADEEATPIDLTNISAADLLQALNDPSSPTGAAVQQWLLNIGARLTGTSRPKDDAAPESQLRPYDLIADDSPHRLSLKQCAESEIVEAAVLRVYHGLKVKLGFSELSGRQITAVVFERLPGSNNGWTSTRWTQVVKPILIRHKLTLPTGELVSVSEPGSEEGAAAAQRAA